MTECIKMSYKGLEMKVNPASISCEMSRNISVSHPLSKHTAVKESADNPCIVRGEGSFTGSDAPKKAYELSLLFKGRGSAYLFMPLLPPMRAYFTGLSVSASGREDKIDYKFTFTEDCSGKERFFAFRYTYAKAGENLYDIANRTGVSVEKIFSLNSFKNLFSVKEGDKVWLSQR